MIDGTPKKVEYWDAQTVAFVESEREYVEATEALTYEEDYYRHTKKRKANLYLDPATGLVVFDVQAYEKWMN